MITHFKAVSTEQFTGTAFGVSIDIIKQLNGKWKVFADSAPTNCTADSARACMTRVDEISQKILKKKMEKLT